MEASRDLKEDRESVSRAHVYLERITRDVSNLVALLENSNKATRSRLMNEVYAAQEDLSIVNQIAVLRKDKKKIK